AHTRVSRILGGTRFRNQDHGEGGCAGVIAERTRVEKLEAASARDERGDRLLSAARTQIRPDPALSRGAVGFSEPGLHHYEKFPGDTRRGPARRVGKVSRRNREHFDYDARCDTDAETGAARFTAAGSTEGRPNIERR